MKLKTLLNIELVISILTVILGILGLDIYQSGYISFILLIVLLILTIIESIKYKKNCTVRITILVISMLTGLILLIGDGISVLILGEYYGVIGLLFGFGIMISLFIVKAKHSKVTLEDNNDIKIINNIPKNKYYPIGYYSFGTVLVFRIIVVLFIIGAVFVGFFWGLDELGLAIAYIISGALIMFSYMIIKGVLIDLKWFKKFYNDLDFDFLEEKMNAMLSNPKIHPESSNYLKIGIASAASFIDLNKWEQLKNELFVPSIPAYRFIYDLSMLHFNQDFETYENSYKDLKEKYKGKNAYLKKLDFAYQQGLAFYTGNIIGSIDVVCPTKTNNNFINCGNLYTQIIYYSHKNNSVKVEQLKKEFIEKYSNAFELVNKINNIE